MKKFLLSTFYPPDSLRDSKRAGILNSRRGQPRYQSVRGQLLVEAIIALSILVVGFLGIVGLLSRSFFLNRVVSDNYTATFLASEGIEVAKNMVDHNFMAGLPWNTGFFNSDFEVEYSSIGLMPYLNRRLRVEPFTNLYSYSGTLQTNFRRRIRITLIGSDELQVNSIVSWTTGSAQSRINLEDHFFDWRP